mmetsp:Transcript_4972/g.6466  ORF Transcript_4972/g.6466 Transcript_4972/m.6466 type:complete len:296 (-) Transcript_4972:781-1668(-)
MCVFIHLFISIGTNPEYVLILSTKWLLLQNIEEWQQLLCYLQPSPLVGGMKSCLIYVVRPKFHLVSSTFELLIFHTFAYYFVVAAEMRTPETLREHIVTFYFQGNGASRAQAASYSGPEGVKSLDEFGDTHHAISHDAPRLLHNAYPYLELNDVAYANVSTTWNPWHWLLVFVSWIKHWYLRIEKAPLYYNIMTNWNVGGFHDVSQHFNGVQNMLQNVSESKRVVLYGASRGAATTLISVSKMPKVMLERIDLVIVEAPFDSVPSVLSSSVTIPGMAQVQLFLLEWIGLYKSTQT